MLGGDLNQTRLSRCLQFSRILGQKTFPPAEASASAYHEAFWALEPDSFETSLRTNAFGAYWMSISFLPLLEKWKNSEGGQRFPPQIVMTSSMNGWTKVGIREFIR